MIPVRASYWMRYSHRSGGSEMRGKSLAIMAVVALVVVVGYDQVKKRQAG